MGVLDSFPAGTRQVAVCARAFLSPAVDVAPRSLMRRETFSPFLTGGL
jgi:hypothetical protein